MKTRYYITDISTGMDVTDAEGKTEFFDSLPEAATTARLIGERVAGNWAVNRITVAG